MANTVSTSTSSSLPTSDILKSSIPKITEKVHETLRGDTTRVLTNLASVIDSSVKAFDKKMREQNWTAAGREYAAAEARAEAEGMLTLIADSATERAKGHMRQLDVELADVPPISDHRASEIRSLLREMNKLDRDVFIQRSDDPEVLAAIVHGPKAFPLAAGETLSRALLNFNRAHRPERVALRDDNETFITAIENYRDAVARQLRSALR